MDPVAPVPSPDRPLVAASWVRCRAAGLRESDTLFLRVSDPELRRRRVEAAGWLPIAREHLATVSELLADLPHALVIADADGILLHCVTRQLPLSPELGLLPGHDWAEARVGTTGVGTALAAGEPVVISGEEHFRSVLRGFTCTAAPLRAPDGTLLGALDLATPIPAGVPGRFALVRYLARAVERELADAVRLRGALASSAAETERARREVLEREAQFRTLADTIPHLAWMADAQGWIFWYNQRWFDYTGMTLEAAAGWGWRAAHHPDHVERVVEKLTRAWESGEAWEDTFPLRGADGEYRWFLSRALPIRDAAGRVVRWFGTNTDITGQIESELALRRAQEELELLYGEARAAVLEREEAVAVVSHDLRAPLNVLGMAAHLLLEPLLPEEQKRKQAQAVASVVAQMSQLVTELLDFTRAREGRLPLELAPLAPQQLLPEVAERAQPLVAAAGVELVLEIEGDPPAVLADASRLQQVFANLVGNALDHTPAGGRITLRAERAPDGVRFEVRDSGAGIPEDELPHIFDRFWRGARAGGSGIGLGLSICKGIIDAHGGFISAASAPGHGTTFAFVLPAAARA